MLLRRMADFQPELVRQAHEQLGADHAELDSPRTARKLRGHAPLGSSRELTAAHNRWQTMLRSRRAPAGLSLYRACLGPPDAQRSVEWGDLTLTECAWRLAGLWPDLRFQVMVGAGEVVLDSGLVRAPDSPVPPLGPPAGLAPWSCVVGDVLVTYPEAQQIDPEVPSRWLVDVAGVRLWFVYGLLQTAE
jgi:hypothetical protein